MSGGDWTVHNSSGALRVVVTKELPGTRWLEILTTAGCEVAVCASTDVLAADEIVTALGDRCDGAIGQLTERWDAALFAALAAAGGKAYSNYAVGYDNVDVAGATAAGIPVGNTPGVLTETTAEMAAALALSAGRRVAEADRFVRAGRFEGWLPTMFLGRRFHGGTVGIVGCGRIGAAFARIMVAGFGMSVVYYDPNRNEALEAFVHDHATLLERHGGPPVTATRAESVDDVLRTADVVSLHTVLDDSTRHLIDAGRLALMKPDAILVNTSRGPVIDEAALVAHCRAHPDFLVGLDVFEHEPTLAPGLAELDNVTIVPHIASATTWTREGMATLAAANVAAVLQGHPVWRGEDVLPFLEGEVPPFAPSIVNAAELGLT